MPTYADTLVYQGQPTIRDLLLAQLTGAGSPVAGVPASSPDRGIVEAEAFFLGLEQLLRVGVAQSISASSAVQAGDSWVDAAATWYGLTRLPAAAAIWTLPLLVAAGAAPLTLHPGDIVQVQATDPLNSVFVLTITSNVVLSAASSYRGTATFAARKLGTASGNVTPGTISAIITGPAGLSIDPVPAQVLATAAVDVETSAALIVRCLGRWGIIGAGWTRTAFDYLIPLYAPTLTRWRVLDANPYGPGTVGVILANAAGPATAGEVAAVQAGLSAPAVRPVGSGAVAASAAVLDALTVNVTIQGDGSNAALGANALAAALALAKAFPIGAATLDNILLEAVLLGGAYKTIAVDIGAGAKQTITPASLPGFGGAVKIAAIDLVAPHVVPANQVLGLTCVVTVV